MSKPLTPMLPYRAETVFPDGPNVRCRVVSVCADSARSGVHEDHPLSAGETTQDAQLGDAGRPKTPAAASPTTCRRPQRIVVTPNNDTFYGEAFLDLGKRARRGPDGRRTVPEGHYSVLQITDVFTNVVRHAWFGLGRPYPRAQLTNRPFSGSSAFVTFEDGQPLCRVQQAPVAKRRLQWLKMNMAPR